MNKVVPNVVLPNDLTAIESEAFINTGIHTVYVPVSVTDIADDAFDSDIVILTTLGSAVDAWFTSHGYTVLDAALME